MTFFCILKVTEERSWIFGPGAGSGVISQRYGSADPDLYQMSGIPNTFFNTCLAESSSEYVGHDTADVDFFLSFVKSWADFDYLGEKQ
jgi:hypothetical protein